MIRFIEKANLPQNKVNFVICGSDDEKILSFFEKENIYVIKNKPNPHIDPSVSSHADMSALHLGKSEIILDKAQNVLAENLEKNGIKVHFTENNISGKYPDDVKLNFAVIGDYVIGNFKHIDENLEKLLAEKIRINVKQGYCKCSVLVLSESSVITDDSSINAELLKNGFQSLLVSKGDVSLHGHEYGFIGGASGKISKDTVVFFGDISRHRDFQRIKEFLNQNRCTYICTDSGPLRDIGGIICLGEK